MTEKLRVDLDDLTLGELHDLRKLSGVPLEEIMTSDDQTLGLAAIVCVLKRREDPSFTMEDALRVKLSELDMRQPDPETVAASNGGAPQLSPEPGPSTLSTS